MVVVGLAGGSEGDEGGFGGLGGSGDDDEAGDGSRVPPTPADGLGDCCRCWCSSLHHRYL